MCSYIRWMPGQNQDSTWVSRLQCVQAAVEAQITALAVSEPETKVALVTFNSEVTIIGDGIQEPVHVAGDKLVRGVQSLSLSPSSIEIYASTSTIMRRLWLLASHSLR